MKEYLVLDLSIDNADDWDDAEEIRAFDHYDAAETYAEEICIWDDAQKIELLVMELKTKKVLKIGVSVHMVPSFTVYDIKD